jgi:hypothetical protein
MTAELPAVLQPPPASAGRWFAQREAVPRIADIRGDIGCASELLLKLQWNTLLCNAPIAAIPKWDIDNVPVVPRIRMTER